MFKTRVVLVLLTALIGAGLVNATPASASVPQTCPADPWWYFSSVQNSTRAAVPTVYGDPGITIGIALTAGATATATATVTGTASLSAIIANASASIGVSMSLALSASVTYSGTYTVPSYASYGWIGAGAKAKLFQWSKWQYVACKGTRVGYGSAKGPYQLPYFWRGYR